MSNVNLLIGVVVFWGFYIPGLILPEKEQCHYIFLKMTRLLILVSNIVSHNVLVVQQKLKQRRHCHILSWFYRSPISLYSSSNTVSNTVQGIVHLQYSTEVIHVFTVNGINLASHNIYTTTNSLLSKPTHFFLQSEKCLELKRFVDKHYSITSAEIHLIILQKYRLLLQCQKHT